MDPKADPCKNFYDFACGQWIQRHQIPPDQSSTDVYTLAEKSIKDELQRIMDDYKGDEKFANEMVRFYSSCLNTTIVENRGDEPLKSILKKLGGWPVVEGDSWSPKSFDWLKVTEKMRSFGAAVDKLFTLTIDVDSKDNSQNRLFLDQPALVLGDRNYYLEGSTTAILNAYFDLMVQSAILLGCDEKRAREEMMDVLQFSVKLAKISASQEERRNIIEMYNIRTVKEVDTHYPNIRIQEIIPAIANTKLKENDLIVVQSPTFFEKFNSLFQHTTKRVIANYMMWTLVFSSFDFLSDEWQQLNLEFQKVFSGTNRISVRDDFCTTITISQFPIAASALYVQNNKQKSLHIKKQASTIVHNLLVKTKQTIRHLSWMKKETKMRAIQKMEAMFSVVGFPDEIFDTQLMNKYYAKLNLKKGEFFENLYQTKKFNDDNDFDKLYAPDPRTDWSMYANIISANAANQLSNNAINILMGLLREPFFATERPSYINIAGIGAVIGHEITHAFDDIGRQFDERGNVADWWDPTTDQAYRKRQKCVIDRYNNYTVEAIGINLNGVNTQGENMADIGGFHIAYQTYKGMEKQEGKESVLPGLRRFTHDQLFWIQLASIWCARGRPEELLQQIMNDPHSPLVFRVNGAFSNLAEFSESFNCPLGSPMNPRLKCPVW